jgi:hypothetical protein
MKHTFSNQAKRAGIAFAAVAAFAALGTGTAQAAQFFRDSVSINSVGFLECAFKETGLTPSASVDYSCAATDVGWLTQCFVRNRAISNIGPFQHVAHALSTNVTLVADKRGTLTSAMLTTYPSEEEVGEPNCPEGTIEAITAIRWCNASLTDTTNTLPGATAPELFLQMERTGIGAVPSCQILPGLPTDIGGTDI